MEQITVFDVVAYGWTLFGVVLTTLTFLLAADPQKLVKLPETRTSYLISSSFFVLNLTFFGIGQSFMSVIFFGLAQGVVIFATLRGKAV